MSAFGKTLVLITVALSLLMLVWSAAIFTQSIDWGWKEPRKDLAGEKIPSELEKREKMVKEYLGDKSKGTAGAIRQAGAAFLKTQKGLEDQEQTFTSNHLWYTLELQKLESERARAGAAVQTVKINKATGSPELQKGRSLPVMVKVEPPLLSFEGYQTALENLEKDIRTASEASNKALAEAAVITEQLSGIHDEDGTVKKKGLYQLQEIEAKALAQLEAEVRHIQPLRIKELVNRAIMIDRQKRLEARVEELRKPKVVTKLP
jgi:hypothetical protein